MASVGVRELRQRASELLRRVEDGESIEITDNGIIPLKERVVDDFYDPLGWFWRWLKRKSDRNNVEAPKR